MKTVNTRPLPIIDEIDELWDAVEAEKQMRELATVEGKIDFEKYFLGFLYRDEGEPEKLGSYKFPIAKVVDGNLMVPFKALVAVMAVLNGARGGADISEADRRAIYNVVVRYYELFDKEAPELKTDESKIENGAIEYKAISFNLISKEETKDQYTFEGYASIFGNIDSGDDMIIKGAFNKTIKSRGKRAIKVLWQHKTDIPIGVVNDAYEDDKGLFVKCKISKTTAGSDAWVLMKDGVVNEMSIGFIVGDSEMVKKDNRLVRKIKEVDLFEVSPVTWGMNSKTSIDEVKSNENTESISKFERRISDLEEKMGKTVAEMYIKLELIEKKVYSNLDIKKKHCGHEIDITELVSEIKKIGGKK